MDPGRNVTPQLSADVKGIDGSRKGDYKKTQGEKDETNGRQNNDDGGGNGLAGSTGDGPGAFQR